MLFPPAFSSWVGTESQTCLSQCALLGPQEASLSLWERCPTPPQAAEQCPQGQLTFFFTPVSLSLSRSASAFQWDCLPAFLRRGWA